MLEIKNLSKSYLKRQPKNQWYHIKKAQKHQVYALNNINMTFEKGKVLGLLGPNGAGKTTLLKILSSLINADHGEILFEQQCLSTNTKLAKKRIGFLSCNSGLYQRLTAQENIQYFARLQGLNKNEIQENSHAIMTSLGIDQFADKPISELSTGMTQKVAIARALIHNPDILILDEPTTGLDIMATESLLSIINTLKAQNKIIIFSTHHLDEVATIADNVAVINEGQLLFQGDITEFKQQFNSDDLRTAFMNSLSYTNDREVL